MNFNESNVRKFGLNRIGGCFQIYGGVNGFARKREYQGIYRYVIDFKFFLNSKLIHITTSEKDNTIKNEQGIIARISKAIDRELAAIEEATGNEKNV